MQRKFDKILGKIMGEAASRPPFSSCPLEETPSVLLAVSGGMDSMCLAELFLHASIGVRFEIAHCNFHLRGEESDSDEALVRSWGERNGVHVNVAEFDTLEYAGKHGLSIEMAARELRYRWFGRLCSERGFVAVAVAHHADDNAETLFLNLVRGTGLKGICGMSPVAALPCQDEDSGCRKPMLIRPLLDFTREQIEGYVRKHRVEYHIDRTNADTKYRRNLIRHEVFPLLERLNPSFIKTVNREMRYFSQANEIVESVFDRSSRRYAPQDDKMVGASQDDIAVIPGEAVSPVIPSEAKESGLRPPNRSSRRYAPQDDIAVILSEAVLHVIPGEAVLHVIPSEAKESDKFTINISELLTAPYWEYRLYRILEQYGFNSSTVASIEELLKANAESSRTLAGKKFFSPSHVLVTTSASLIVGDRASRPLRSSRRCASQDDKKVGAPQDDNAVIPGETVSPVIPSEAVSPVIPSEAKESGLRPPNRSSRRYAPQDDKKVGTLQDDNAVIPGEAVPPVIPSEAKESVLVDTPGEYHVGKTRFTVEVVPRSEIPSLKAPSGTVYWDYDALPFPFVCRRWRHGDWLRPFGMRGKKKVSDLFTDLKYDILRKDDAVLIEAPESSDGHVLALLGERIDDSVKITDRTLNVIVARVL